MGCALMCSLSLFLPCDVRLSCFALWVATIASRTSCSDSSPAALDRLYTGGGGRAPGLVSRSPSVYVSASCVGGENVYVAVRGPNRFCLAVHLLSSVRSERSRFSVGVGVCDQIRTSACEV